MAEGVNTSSFLIRHESHQVMAEATEKKLWSLYNSYSSTHSPRCSSNSCHTLLGIYTSRNTQRKVLMAECCYVPFIQNMFKAASVQT